jgi:F-type H+-transporting ATPase subunit epsilon
MASTLKLEIVTPESKTYSEDVEMVTLPGAQGEMGIFPQHVPMMTQIVAGEIIARKGGRDYFLAVGDGFVQITAERVAVMTDMAIRAENIDEAKAEEARRRAEARLSEKIEGEEAAVVSASLAHSLAQLKVKRRQVR